jgi:thiosulfate/3-mercaptopyruvate sulfurtransferase
VAIISPEELAGRIGDPELRICDVRWYLGHPGRGRARYEAGHLPGAIFVDLDADLSAPTGPGRHPLPDPRAFAARMSELGIGSQHFVVAYDDAGGGVAARLWWMLDDLGHARVAVLDGGLGTWVEAGMSLTTEPIDWPPARLEIRDRWTKVIDREELRGRLGTVTLLDARAPERYRGEVEPVDPVAGHIPTAICAPLVGSLGPDGRFLAPDRLAERFRALGAGPRAGTGASADDGLRDVVTSCGSGTNACQNALAMRVAGLPDPLLYPGSFSDWSRSGLPVATGPEPGGTPAT